MNMNKLFGLIMVLMTAFSLSAAPAMALGFGSHGSSNIPNNNVSDLEITDITFPSSILINQDFTVSVEYKNLGPKDLEQNTEITVKLEGSQNQNVVQEQTASITKFDADDNDRFKEFTFNVPIEGEYKITAEIDAVNENSNTQANNQKTKTFTVCDGNDCDFTPKNVDFNIINLDIPETTQGSAFSAKITYENKGPETSEEYKVILEVSRDGFKETYSIDYDSIGIETKDQYFTVHLPYEGGFQVQAKISKEHNNDINNQNNWVEKVVTYNDGNGVSTTPNPLDLVVKSLTLMEADSGISITAPELNKKFKIEAQLDNVYRAFSGRQLYDVTLTLTHSDGTVKTYNDLYLNKRNSARIGIGNHIGYVTFRDLVLDKEGTYTAKLTAVAQGATEQNTANNEKTVTFTIGTGTGNNGNTGNNGGNTGNNGNNGNTGGNNGNTGNNGNSGTGGTSQTGNVQLSGISIGGTSQEREEVASTTLTITNKGTQSLTNLVFAFVQKDTSATSKESSFAFVHKNLPTSILAGQTATVTLEMFVPDDFAAIDSNSCAATSFSVGTLTFTGTLGSTTETVTSDVKLQAENLLSIDSVRVVVNGKSTRVEDGDEVDAIPDDNVVVELRLENNGEDEIEGDAEINVEGDFDIDESEEFDVADDDKETIEFSFSIDEDVEDSERAIICAIGRDNNGALFGEQLEFDFEVDLENDALEIVDTEISEEIDLCEESTARVEVKFQNTGKDEQEESFAVLEIPQLGVNEESDSIQIDTRDTESALFSFQVPKNTASGLYSGTIQVLGDNERVLDEQDVSIRVKSCTKRTETTQPVKTAQPKGNNDLTTQPPLQDVAEQQSSSLIPILEMSLLLFFILLCIGLIVVGTKYLIEKRKQGYENSNNYSHSMYLGQYKK